MGSPAACIAAAAALELLLLIPETEGCIKPTSLYRYDPCMETPELEEAFVWLYMVDVGRDDVVEAG